MSRTARAVVALVVLLTSARCGSMRAGRFVGSLTYQAAATTRGPNEAQGPRGRATLAVRAAAMSGARVGPLVALGLAGGASAPLGGHYDLALAPIGLGLRLHGTGFVGVTLALGVAGGTAQDDAVGLAGQAHLELDLGRRVRVLGLARIGRALAIDPALPARTTELTLAVRLGRRFDQFVPSSNGYFLGATAAEREGQTQLGLVLGHSLDAGR